MSNEFMTPVGRLIQGHPMDIKTVIDDKTNLPKINKRGEEQQEVYVGIAIVKGNEQHWNQTEWGALIWAAGQAGWPQGEWQAATFAWKIIDGDSTIPNKKGKRPCDQEGMPGHWVINAKNGWVPDCFANGNYGQQVMRKETFKCGDYVRLVITSEGNAPSQSPGVYVNLAGCELVRAGQPIVSATSIDAQATFGSAAAVMPAGAQVDTNIPAPAGQQSAPPPADDIAPPPPAKEIAPQPDFLMYNGKQYTEQKLRDGGWSDSQIDAIR